jgi:mRNA interferase MazF
LKRGDLVTVAGDGDYAGKPRPALIVQSDAFSETGTVTVCLLTTTELEAPLLRLPVEPTPANGLARRSWIMVDKLTTIRRDRIGRIIGALADTDMLRVNRALLPFLGLAGA